MISKIEVEMMKNAYSLMYTIENSLRIYITKEMEVAYGLNWYKEGPRAEKLKPYNKPFNRLYFYELISFLILYPCLSRNAPEKVVLHFHQLIPLRNKIAHHICLSETEVNTLNECYYSTLQYLKNP